MRVTRKLFLASVLALTALAMVASSASAVTIRQEPNNTDCPSNPSVSAHVVTGGCHVNFSDADGIPLLAHTGAAEVSVSNCAVTLEARLGTTGSGWATNQTFTDPVGTPPGTCTRRPCDETNMAKREWPVSVINTASLEAVFCLRTAASGEGGAQTFCHIVLPISASGHVYTIGVSGVEYQCEGLPVEISDVELVSPTAPATERIEISP